ncbi:MAG: hypothetical protein LBT18_00300 [Endomicrobium sp.]|nr:hypothetical protein [Endomicrobium sp.]
MGYCVNCLFQGDNSLDEQDKGRVFCLVKRKWLSENDLCEDFTEYADLSKEIRSKYAFEIRENKTGSNKIGVIVKQSWKAMMVSFILAFVLFIATVKFFDKYIF